MDNTPRRIARVRKVQTHGAPTQRKDFDLEAISRNPLGVGEAATAIPLAERANIPSDVFLSYLHQILEYGKSQLLSPLLVPSPFPWQWFRFDIGQDSEQTPRQDVSHPRSGPLANMQSRRLYGNALNEVSDATPKAVVFHRCGSSHLFYILQDVPHIQVRVKLNRVFFPRCSSQARSLGCGFALI